MSKLELSPYQETGVEFLTGKKHALLADDMGLGKTVQAIVAAMRIEASAILIICPAIARVNWKREFKVWTGLNFTVCEKLNEAPSMLTVVSYEFAVENVELLASFAWDLVLVDESQFVKEPTAARTQAIYGKNGIIRKAYNFWCLSGTPAPNHPAELWPMLYTFGATELSYEDFVDTYCEVRPTHYAGGKRVQILGAKKSAIAGVRNLLSGVMLRRLKKDVLKDLPKVSYETVTVEGTPLTEVIQDDIKRAEAEKSLVEEKLQGLTCFEKISAVLEKLGDSVSSLRRFVGLQKVKPVAELVSQELGDKAYQKIVIFGIHTQVIQQLKVALSNFNAVTVYGRISAKKRQEHIDSFQNDPNCRVFIGNIAAAGTAITLTAANQVLFIEQDWVPGSNAQATDRVNRRGQTLPVSVRVIALEDSLDQKIARTLMRKSSQLTQIFDYEGEE